jgi:hypothetical protein
MDEKDKELFKRWMNHKFNKSKAPRHRLSKYFEENPMSYAENFDEYFHQNNKKPNLSKEEFMRLMKEFRQRMEKNGQAASSGMVVLFEEDYENLLEMRGYFKMSNMNPYVETINKIISTLIPKDMQ